MTVEVNVESLLAKKREIDEMDATLDAQSGSKAAGKRSIKNGLANEANTTFVDSVVEQIRENLSGDTSLGTVLAVISRLEDEFGDDIDERVNELLEENQVSESEKMSDEEIQALAENRKERVKEFKALKEILEMFGEDVSNVPDPKSRRGSRGPRGPRTLSKFQYRINETDLEPEVNSLSTVAKLSGGLKVKDLKEFITAQGVDLKNPPAEWSAELPNDVGTLTATALPEYEDDFSDDEESEDDNEAAEVASA